MNGLSTEKEVEGMINQLGKGSVGPVVYDTTWVASVPDYHDLKKPAYPQALEWLRGQQLQDGTWGATFPYAHDKTLSTLGAILAFKRWNEAKDITRIEFGIKALWQQADELIREEHDSIGFELLLPTLQEEARKYNLDIPYKIYEQFSEKSNQKKQLIAAYQHQYGTGKPATWWFSLEALGLNQTSLVSQTNVKPEDFLTQDGSVGGSPSATAYLLMQQRLQGQNLPKADACLSRLVKQYNGGIAHVSCVDGIDLTFGPDFFIKAGLPATHPLLKPAINRLLTIYNAKKGIGYFSGFLPDADETSLAIETLHLAGHPVSLEPLLHFYNHDHMCTYVDERHPAISINIHALTALRLFQGKPEIDNVIQNLINWLNKSASPTGAVFTDKWHSSPFYNTSRAIFALYGLDNALVNRCLDWLLEQQKEDGGWGVGSESSLEETAYVTLALCYLNREKYKISKEAIKRAGKFLSREEEAPAYLWIGKVLCRYTTTVNSGIVAARYAVDQLN